MVPRKTPKILEQEQQEEESMMKRVIHTPNSSVKSSATTDLYNNPSETRDSFYFPGCRKDANCCCEICIESINATLDLVQESRHSFLTRRIPSPSRTRLVSRTPVTFDSSSADLSTPEPIAKIRPVADSPPLKSTARMNFEGNNVKREKSDFGRNWVFVRRILLGLVLVFVMEYGFSWLVCRVSRSNFSTDLVKDLALKSRGFENLNGKFVFLKKELEWYAGKKIATCTSADAVWKVNQEGLLLNSRCVLYKSMTEEVSIWGWPLQTAGLLTAECASRSLTIISGRVTEWSHEDAKYLVREANSTWEQGKWSSSVVQFDPNTWILEYKRGFLADNARLTSAVVKLLKARVLRGFEKMRGKSSLLSSFVNLYSAFTDRSILTPT